MEDSLKLRKQLLMVGADPETLDAYVEAKVTEAVAEARSRFFKPWEVEAPATVGHFREALGTLDDDAQVFVNITGHGEDYAVDYVWRSEQISYDSDKLTVGLEIALGLWPNLDEKSEEDS